MNRAALELPQDQLIPELDRRIERKTAELAERDATCGKHRIHVFSYMENIGWPELFGYDMNRFLNDPEFCIEQSLRQIIFWADNVDDDSIPCADNLFADTGMYWDATLFGQEIRHTPIGVPDFLPHPFQQHFDLDSLGKFDFHASGDMPRIIEKFFKMRDLAQARYGGRVGIGFPHFHRGPLDLYVQLRGYDNFLEDLAERPEGLQAGLAFFVDARHRFAVKRAELLGAEQLPETTFIADDWVNIPFISPRIFREFVMPTYSRIQENEGPVTGFHTCGNFLHVVHDLLEVFPRLDILDVGAWNDLEKLDAAVTVDLRFAINIKNTVTLGDHAEEQMPILETIAKVAKRRPVKVCAGAIVKLHSTYEENFFCLNRFLARTRTTLRMSDY